MGWQKAGIAAGADADTDWTVFDDYVPRSGILTPNTDVSYVMMFADLEKTGPLVLGYPVPVTMHCSSFRSSMTSAPPFNMNSGSPDPNKLSIPSSLDLHLKSKLKASYVLLARRFLRNAKRFVGFCISPQKGSIQDFESTRE
jgi:hypothetical protein